MASTLDEAALAQLARDFGGQEAVREIVDAFLSEAKRLEPHLLDGQPEGPRSFVRAAHTLRSAGSIVGAQALAEVCAQVETLAREGRRDDALDLVPALVEELRRAVAALQKRFS